MFVTGGTELNIFACAADGIRSFKTFKKPIIFYTESIATNVIWNDGTGSPAGLTF
jgi:hypothetical protein